MSKSLQRTSYRDPNSSVRVEDGRLTRTFSPLEALQARPIFDLETR